MSSSDQKNMASFGSPDYKSENKLDPTFGAVAYISLTGVIIECNKEFALLYGVELEDLKGKDITSLATYDNPEALMESAYELDKLGDSNTGKTEWTAKTVLSSSFLSSFADSKYEDFPQEYLLVAKRSEKRINGKRALEVVLNSIVSSPQKGDRRRESLEAVAKLDAKCEKDIASLGTQRVLIVDDSPATLKLMRHMITRLGHFVATATNGVDALDQLSSETFDIVLMDINMPKMNGLEASHEFRKIERRNRQSGRPYQKIIAMSGDISNTLFHEVTNAGFDAFIPKPLTEERFFEVLRLKPADVR